MQKLKKAFVVLSLASAMGCGSGGEGRIVGFVVDGQSGQRLNFFKSNDGKNNVDDDDESKSQVYAIIQGEFRRAKPCGEGDLSKENGIEADGCYQIDGIPLGEEFPIIAQAPGYERFLGRYTMQTWDKDVEHESAQEVVNLRVFPTGFAVDYRFLVNLNGRGVADAKVNCQYRADQGNMLQTAGNFLQPEATASTTVSATTDANGIAVIPGAQLVNGAPYHCEAVLAGAVDGRVLSGQSDIVAGMSQPEQAFLLTNPGAQDANLYAVYSNADDPDALLGANGSLVVTFNRPVEIAPRTEDCQVAALETADRDIDGSMGRFVTNQVNNNASETVNATVSADGLTLTVAFKTPETPLDADDRNTLVRFSGVIVRPRGAVDAINVRYLGALGACAEANVYGNAQQLRSVRGNGAQSSTIRLF
ncbi:hypothetical protein HPC49_31570 [Pyxidicoccus fallax]|uniref:Lipoprotein n=1 Tax=Pyxidicoccus fallax TaxID=394095 RepID=A0A848LH52_9BACT|nr:hypothetical protein [Pyxidicoccus fallax]NMO16965.1 hypothetical protein [Pyxidicoccus fallax]NPC82749.1 hypothetical protein [Pyxidicoccus fallax]